MIRWHSWNAKPAFEGLNPADYEHDEEGFWRHGDPLWRDLLEATRPHLLIEVGAYKGRTSIFLAHLIKEMQLQTKIVCIDTWVGSPEHWRTDHGDEYWELKTKFGYPTLYYSFAANVVLAGAQDVIIPLPTTSESGAYILEQAKLSPDIVFVDAAHEYEPALSDYRRYWGLLRQRGVLVGDDYMGPGWDGVTKAADDFSAEIGVPLSGKVGKFVIAKDTTRYEFNESGGLIVNG
jgi:SAM-dependent methyltransferase